MKLLNTIRNYRNYRKTIRELDRLSDLELSDIGISRGDIFRIARELRKK